VRHTKDQHPKQHHYVPYYNSNYIIQQNHILYNCLAQFLFQSMDLQKNEITFHFTITFVDDMYGPFTINLKVNVLGSIEHAPPTLLAINFPNYQI
jgi:hypothetical protein